MLLHLKTLWDIESTLSNLQSATHSKSEDLPFTVKLIYITFNLHNYLIDVQDESIEVNSNNIDNKGEFYPNNDANIQKVAVH